MKRGVIGLDVGTGGARAVLLTEDGTIAATFQAAYGLSLPREGWAEQDPEEWWQSSMTVLRNTVHAARNQGVTVEAVGLTGQMHGAVFLDARGDVLRPAIIWMDGRTQGEARDLQLLGERRGSLAQTLNPALANFTATRILWLQRHEPEHWARTEVVLLPKDYIRFRLTGEFATDVSDASGTWLLDVGERAWSAALREMLTVTEAQLPRVYESDEITGYVRPDVGTEIGFDGRVPVVAGAGDQAAAAMAAGVERPGTTALSIGTSGVVLSVVGEPTGPLPAALHMFCHAVRETWFAMGVTQAAGGSLRWLRDVIGGGRDYGELSDLAAAAPPGADGLMFAPYLAGERCPHADPGARGSFVGLTARHGMPELVRSVMEGVAYSLRDVVEAMGPHGGRPTRIVATGGAAKSPVWREIVEMVLDMPVEWMDGQGPAAGAALLAARCAFSEPQFAVRAERIAAAWPRDGQERENGDRAKHAVYQDGYARYRKLYAQTKVFWQEA